MAATALCQPQRESLDSLYQRAEHGDAKAQDELGDRYGSGIGGAHKDYGEALKWYRKAAEQGNLPAKFDIARMYFDGIGVERSFAEAARWYGCPKPSKQALSSCRASSYEDFLPREALDLLDRMKCDVGSNYDYGNAVDLNGDGEPEYLMCCHDAPHRPCSAVLIGKVGSGWRELAPKQPVEAFPACGLFIVLDSQHNGFHDICLPHACGPDPPVSNNVCTPTILQFLDGQYRSVAYTPVQPPK